MLETPHVAVGAAIAMSVANPALAIPLALGSHFVLDRIPHWNPHTYTETQRYGKPTRKSTALIVADSVLALILGSYIAYLALPQTGLAITVLLASFAAVFPDVSKSPFYFLKNKNGLLKKWVDYERSLQVEIDSPALGMFIQLLIVAASIWWIVG